LSEDSILLDIVQEKGNRFDYSIHNIFADSYNLCAHEELIRPNEAALIKQPYRSCLENPLIVVNAVTGISTSGYTKLNSHVQASPSADA
jgi:hypothetical protein